MSSQDFQKIMIFVDQNRFNVTENEYLEVCQSLEKLYLKKINPNEKTNTIIPNTIGIGTTNTIANLRNKLNYWG